jgi:hypothetical protein
MDRKIYTTIYTRKQVSKCRIWGRVHILARFQAFTVVVKNTSMVWDVTPCSLLIVDRCFRGAYGLHLRQWRWRPYAPLKYWAPFELHTIPPKTVLFIVTIARSLYPKSTIISSYIMGSHFSSMTESVRISDMSAIPPPQKAGPTLPLNGRGDTRL